MEDEIIETIEETNYYKLRYILNDEGYICNASFGGEISCSLGTCTEYKGEVPSGYSTIEEWYDAEIEKLNAWKIVNGNLVFDENKYNELQTQYKVQAEENACATKKYVNDKLGGSTTIFDDNMSKTTTDLVITDCGDYEIPEIIIEGKGDLKTSTGVIEDARNEVAQKLIVNGKSYQETYNGNQLIDFKNYSSKSSEVTYTFENDTIVCSNTPKGYATITWEILSIFKENPNKVLKFSYGSFESTAGAGVTVQLDIAYTDGTNSYIAMVGRTGNTANYTVPNDVSNMSWANISIRPNNNGVAQEGNLTISKPLLYFDDNNNYEPYVGGKASPNPNYSQEIESVGYENLFNKDNVNVLNGYFYGNGNILEASTGRVFYIPCEPNTTYTANKIESARFSFGYTEELPTIGTLTYSINNNSAISLTIKTGINAKYLVMWYYASSYDTLTEKEILNSIQIGKGSIARSYIPNGKYGIEVKTTGKNFFDENTVLTNTIASATTGNLSANNVWNTSDLIECEANTTYIRSNKTTDSTNIYLVEYDENNNFVKVNYNISFTTTADTKYLRLCYRNDIGMYNIQLEKGHTATEYETFKKNSTTLLLNKPLRNLPNGVKDTCENGVITRRVGSIVFNGSEAWTLTKGTNRYSFWVRNTSIKNCLTAKHPKYCNYFAYSNLGYTTAPIPSLCENDSAYNASNFMFIFNTDGSQGITVDEWKTWLSENNVEVLYELATPETEEVDYTPLELLEGYNQITTSDELQPDLNISYRSQSTTFTDDLNVQVTGKNVLINEATNQTINGLDFTVNEDKTISISGKATADTEYILNGSMDNIDPIFMLNNSNNFCPNTFNENILLNLYSYDGTDRELVYSGSSGTIELDTTKYITCSTLKIANGTTVNVTINPDIQLDTGDVTYEFVEPKLNDILNVNITELKQDEYIKIDRSYIKLIGTDKTTLKVIEPLTTFKPCTLIQTNNNDLTLTTKYFTDDYLNERVSKIEVEQNKIRLEVSQTYSTKEETSIAKQEAINSANENTENVLQNYSTNTETQNAKAEAITEAVNSANASTDSKLANYSTTTEMNAAITLTAQGINTEVAKKVNGTEIISAFNQSAEEIKLDAKKIALANFEITDDKLISEIIPEYDYTEDDITKIRNYLLGNETITEEEFAKYDANSDGVINSADILIIRQMVNSGISTTKPGKFEIDTQPDTPNVIKFYDGSGNLRYSIGYWTSNFRTVYCETLYSGRIEADNMDAGRNTITTKANATVSETIYFNHTFPEAPCVTATQVTSNPNNSRKVGVGNITTEKFDLFVYDTSNASITVCWNAMSNEHY